MRRVCVLTSVHPPFDTRVFHKQCTSLAKAGYDVTLLAAAPFQERVVNAVKVKGLGVWSGRMRRMLSSVTVLRRALAEKADIYHFHDPELIPVGLILRLLGRRVIYDVHEHYPDDIMLKYWIPLYLRKIISVSFDWFERSTARFFSAIVTADEDVAVRFPKAKRRVVLFNYPRLEELTVSGKPQETRTYDVVYVGLLSWERGVDVLVEAVRLIKQGRHPGIRAVIAGNFSDPKLEQEVHSYIQTHDLQSAVTFLGRIDHSAVAEVLTNSRIGVIPLRPVPKHQKNIPTKLFEYMLCGLPVVSSKLAPVCRYFENVPCGIAVPSEDPESFANAISDLIQDRNKLATMARAGQAAIRQTFNWEQEEAKLLRLYQEILA